MTRLFLPLALLLASASPALADPAPAPKGQDVTLSISGVVGALGGHLIAAIQTEDQFLKGPAKYSQKLDSSATKDGVAIFTFHDVAPGDYAFTILHDQDDDGKMKMTAGGMPGEGWAMHNGTLLLAAPTFDAVAFTVGDQPVSLMEPMTYFTP